MALYGAYSIPDMRSVGPPIATHVTEAIGFKPRVEYVEFVGKQPFFGIEGEKALEHLVAFEEQCRFLASNGIPEENIFLILFPFSLKGKAKTWFQSHPPSTFTTWEQLSKAFLYKFYP